MNNYFPLVEYWIESYVIFFWDSSLPIYSKLTIREEEGDWSCGGVQRGEEETSEQRTKIFCVCGPGSCSTQAQVGHPFQWRVGGRPTGLD